MTAIVRAVAAQQSEVLSENLSTPEYPIAQRAEASILAVGAHNFSSKAALRSELLMSTQFDTSIVDLDRTDELPVLDVAAYEASLASNDNSLSRTDTWAVEPLRVVNEPDDKPVDAVALSTVSKQSAHAEALTINVERILKRIAELEAKIVATRDANATLQRDCEALRAERTQDELRTRALQAENAQLCEHRALSDQTAQRFEQQLCDRAETIAELEESLSNEKNTAADLSRQLAAKLTDCGKAVSIIEQRNRTIDDLIRGSDDLNQRLQQEIAAGGDLTARLAVAERSLHESHALLLEHDDVIVKHDAQLMQAQAQILSLTEERDALRSASAEFEARAANFDQKDAELAQLHGELVAARAEVQSQTKLLNERTDELGALRRKFNEHETTIRGFEQANRVRGEYTEELTTQLRAARDEQAVMTAQLDKARARVENLSEQIFSRDNQIAALQADLAVHTEVLAAIHRDVNRIGDRANAELDKVEHILEPVGHEGPTLYLIGEVLTVGRTSDNDISIPSKLVSRRHARLIVGPTGVIIEDANSANGCYVNGKQVHQHLLHDGDVLELADMRYRLRTLAAHDAKIDDTKIRLNVVRISDSRRSDTGSIPRHDAPRLSAPAKQ